MMKLFFYIIFLNNIFLDAFCVESIDKELIKKKSSVKWAPKVSKPVQIVRKLSYATLKKSAHLAEQRISYPTAWTFYKKEDFFNFKKLFNHNFPQNYKEFSHWYNMLYENFGYSNLSKDFFAQCLYKVLQNQSSSDLIIWFKKYQTEHTDWLVKWFDYTYKNMDSLDFKKLTNLIPSFSKLNINPEHDWLKEWCKKSLHHLPHFQSKKLTSILRTLINFGYEFDEKWLEKLDQCYVKCVNSCTGNELSDIAYLHAILQRPLPNEWIARLPERFQNTFKNYHNYYKVHVYNVSFSQEPIPLRTSVHIEEIIHKNSTANSSALQAKIGKVLKLVFNESIEKEYWLPYFLTHVDFYLPSKKLIIQVDGPSHYLKKTQDLNYKTLSQNIAFSKNNYNFVRIPYFEWNALKNNLEAQQSYLTNQLINF